ncbi:MAG: sigma 54-interacting transcriptional regulator [Myxococcaceae bacterium]|nr:sigma 54-interacting transcriptional regulator [Myxococcaceae bacterium]MCI0670933.1 sigma 54-interacting transcriptional regulator [Myxococcaceae bacterium]
MGLAKTHAPITPDDVPTAPGDEVLDDALQEALITSAQALPFEQRASFRLRRCRLEVRTGPHAGREVLTDKEHVRVGAHATNDVVLAGDRTVSRHHCDIRTTERGYLLVDLGSTNGTFLDGRRVERAYLSTGSLIRVGQSTLHFSLVDEEVRVEPAADGQLGEMIGASVKMRQVFSLIRKIAPLDLSVVLQGETGTGKELVARAIHSLSARRTGPLVVLDCGAIPPDLIESELFGHEKGAFTGATSARPGAFERARGGTIFLDELGELRLDLQPKLLRVLENREVRRVGSNDVLPVDVRIIAATHRDLAEQVAAGQFREDLFFRLSVLTVQLPPLRERTEDLPLIVRRALADAEVVALHGHKRFSPAALEELKGYRWPGNVRELMNVLSHVLTFSEGDEVLPEHLPPRVRGNVREGPLPFNEHLSFKDAKEQLLEKFEREYLTQLLRRCGGNISRAARESGVHRKSIERLVKKHGLDSRAMKQR